MSFVPSLLFLAPLFFANSATESEGSYYMPNCNTPWFELLHGVSFGPPPPDKIIIFFFIHQHRTKQIQD